MNTSLHTVRALLVSSSEAQTQRISALLTRARIVPFDHAGSAQQALEHFDAGGIDGVLIAEPIAGSSGRELALQLKKRHCMAVLLLAAPEHAGTTPPCSNSPACWCCRMTRRNRSSCRPSGC